VQGSSDQDEVWKLALGIYSLYSSTKQDKRPAFDYDDDDDCCVCIFFNVSKLYEPLFQSADPEQQIQNEISF